MSVMRGGGTCDEVTVTLSAPWFLASLPCYDSQVVMLTERSWWWLDSDCSLSADYVTVNSAPQLSNDSQYMSGRLQMETRRLSFINFSISQFHVCLYFSCPCRGWRGREVGYFCSSPQASNEEINDQNLKLESKKAFRSEIRIIHYSPLMTELGTTQQN